MKVRTLARAFCVASIVAMLLLSPGCGFPFPVIIPISADLSDFDEFSFWRDSGLGFCPPENAVFTAEIRKEADGAYLVEMSVLKEGVAGVDECVDADWADCLVARELAPRYLTDAEVEELLGIFRSLTVELVVHYPAVVDYCLIDTARWDDLMLDTGVTNTWFLPYPALGDAQREEIVAFLEQLRAASQP